MARLSAVLAAMAVFTSACGTDAASEHTPAGRTATASGVGIEVRGCGLQTSVASGAVVGISSTVVTSAHVVAGASSISVIDANGKTHEAEITGFDSAADVAVLHVVGLTSPPLVIGEFDAEATASLMIFDPVEGLTARPVRLVRQLLVSIEDIFLEQDVERRAIEFIGHVDKGDSGGVLLIDDEIVGLVYARSRDRDNVGFAVDGTELSRALDLTPETSDDHSRCVP